jgi:hypothetical protein
MTEKYTMLLRGLEVIGQVLVAQPMNFQYRYPPSAPATAPIIDNLFLSIHCFISDFFFGFSRTGAW